MAIYDIMWPVLSRSVIHSLTPWLSDSLTHSFIHALTLARTRAHFPYTSERTINTVAFKLSTCGENSPPAGTGSYGEVSQNKVQTHRGNEDCKTITMQKKIIMHIRTVVAFRNFVHNACHTMYNEVSVLWQRCDPFLWLLFRSFISFSNLSSRRISYKSNTRIRGLKLVPLLGGIFQLCYWIRNSDASMSTQLHFQRGASALIHRR